jgi:hypothetical protein
MEKGKNIMRGEKKISLIFVLFTLIFVFTSSIAGAKSQGQGVPHLLSDILVELGNIESKLDFSCDNCATIKGAGSSEGLVAYDPNTGEVAVGTYELVQLVGPGTFVSARLTKQGGAGGFTAVSLEIDGKTIVQRNFVALKNFGMTQNNPFGVMISTSAVGIDAVTIGFSQPIEFEESLILKAIVGESGVIQIIGTVIYGE